MSQRKVSIAIIGAGSIGTLFGGYLASLKSEFYSLKVVFFVKDSHFDVINSNGLQVKKPDSKIILKNFEIFKDVEDFKNQNTFSFDFIFITTKAYDIKTVLRHYKEILDECKNLVILQNGIGNEEVVIESCERSKIIRGVTTNGALTESPGSVIHTGIGITKFGLPFNEANLSNQSQENLDLLKDLLNIAGLETIIVDDILKECWEKIFVNIGINAIGALTRLRNGELLKHKGLKTLMAGAIKEALIIAEKKKISLSNKDYIALTYDVAEKTRQNKNSMLQDVLKGKNTEIDFINGRIVDYAKALDIEVPINAVLTSLIKGLERI